MRSGRTGGRTGGEHESGQDGAGLLWVYQDQAGVHRQVWPALSVWRGKCERHGGIKREASGEQADGQETADGLLRSREGICWCRSGPKCTLTSCEEASSEGIQQRPQQMFGFGRWRSPHFVMVSLVRKMSSASNGSPRRSRRAVATTSHGPDSFPL